MTSDIDHVDTIMKSQAVSVGALESAPSTTTLGWLDEPPTLTGQFFHNKCPQIKELSARL